MKKKGHNIEIITPHKSTEVKEFEGIKVHCIGTVGPPGVIALKMIRKALKTDCDLFYCHESVSYTHLTLPTICSV